MFIAEALVEGKLIEVVVVRWPFCNKTKIFNMHF